MFSEQDLLFLVPDQSAAAAAEGGFARRVLVLCKSSGADGRAFLEKVLASVQINLAQDTLFASIPADAPVALASALREKQPAQVLIFGLTPADLGLHLQVALYQPITFQNTTLLFAEDLPVLEPDRERKTRLWNALKTIFQAS